MDASIMPKAQFAHLASRYRPNLRLRESITTRRRKVMGMFAAKVRIRPIQGDGFSSRGMQPIFRTHTLGGSSPNCFGILFSLEYNYLMASLLGWRVRVPLLAEFQKDQRWILASFRGSH
jgi:hypothetical protein